MIGGGVLAAADRPNWCVAGFGGFRIFYLLRRTDDG
jgi:hypothetical protein